MGVGLVNMIKGTQGNLFPKGSKENPYSKEPRAVGARAKRQYKKDQAEKLKNQKISDDARARENAKRKERGEPPMPLD